LEPRSWLEILDAIINELGVPPDARVEVAGIIDKSFGRIGLGLITREGKTTLVQRAKKIVDVITAVERELATLPPPLYYLLTPPAARVGTPLPPDDLLVARTKYQQTMLEPLRGVRFDCEKLISDQAQDKQPAGEEMDYVQRYSALFAFNLVKQLAGKPTGYAKGPYCQIASLVYEGLTGRRGVDLRQHHCLPVMNERRRAEQQLQMIVNKPTGMWTSPQTSPKGVRVIWKRKARRRR